MKKLFLVMFAFSLINPCFSEDNFLNSIDQKNVQDGITSEIKTFSSFETSEELTSYVNNKCDKQIEVMKKNEATQDEINFIKEDCKNKINTLSSLDIETAKAGVIANLQEAQVAAWHPLPFTAELMCWGPYGCLRTESQIRKANMLLPFVIIVDIAFLPFNIALSLLYLLVS